jgi:hypothetical protein
MAMEEPRAGIVSMEGDDKPPETRKHGDVATSWVAEVQGFGVGGCVEGPGSVACAEGAGEERGFTEDKEIMALELRLEWTLMDGGKIVRLT